VIRSLRVVAACLTVLGCAPRVRGPFAPHSGTEGDGVVGTWVQSGIYQRSYLLTIPPQLSTRTSWPLLIMVHGAGGTAEGLHRWIAPDSATTAAGFIAVYPQGLDRSWNVGCGACTSAGLNGVDDIRFINTLIRQLADSLPIDTTRVFLGGHSLGAQFAHYYACESELAPAGVVAVSGLWLRRTAVRCKPRRDFPVMMIHGDRDRILPWTGPRRNISALSMPEAWDRWYEVLGCTAEPVVTEGADRAGDGTSVQRTRVDGCRGGTSIELDRIRGGGHGWPGAAGAGGLGPTTSNFDGLAEILRFFGEFASRPGPGGV
jgi:polyhydroxybutyrate depolymerase